MVKAWSVAADSPPGLIFRFASWQKVQLAQRSQAIRYYQSRKSLFAIMFVRVPLSSLGCGKERTHGPVWKKGEFHAQQLDRPN